MPVDCGFSGSHRVVESIGALEVESRGGVPVGTGIVARGGGWGVSHKQGGLLCGAKCIFIGCVSSKFFFIRKRGLAPND